MNFGKSEAEAGEKTSELSSRKSLMNCLCREAKAELRMKINRVVDMSHRTTYRYTKLITI